MTQVVPKGEKKVVRRTCKGKIAGSPESRKLFYSFIREKENKFFRAEEGDFAKGGRKMSS